MKVPNQTPQSPGNSVITGSDSGLLGAAPTRNRSHSNLQD